MRSLALSRAAAPLLVVLLLSTPTALQAQERPQPDWEAVEEETLRQFQALIRLDTRNPPGNETLAAEYLKEVLEAELHRFVRFYWDVVLDIAAAR
jgi:hypothetical protein